MSEELRTNRLLLRRACWDDLEPMHRVLRDPQATRYWSTPPHVSLEQTRDWLGSMIDASPDISDDFIITCDGAVIGKLGCWRIPEIGFILGSSHWGQGLATEAMSAFVDHRRSAGGTELTADVDPRNIASLRLLQRFGFEETGRVERSWKVGDEWCDSIYLRLDLCA